MGAFSSYHMEILFILICFLAGPYIVYKLLNWLDKEFKMRLFGTYIMLIGGVLFFIAIYNYLQIMNAQTELDNVNSQINTGQIALQIARSKMWTILGLLSGVTFIFTGFKIRKKRNLQEAESG